MDTLKTVALILIGLFLLVGGIVIGVAIAYSPYGFPRTFAPPARQETTPIPVTIGPPDNNTQWLKSVSAYLVPFYGIKGNRNYSVLILVSQKSVNINIPSPIILDLKTENTDVIQPIIITPRDFTPDGNIVVKLLDQGPNGTQYYRNARGVTLNLSKDQSVNWTIPPQK